MKYIKISLICAVYIVSCNDGASTQEKNNNVQLCADYSEQDCIDSGECFIANGFILEQSGNGTETFLACTSYDPISGNDNWEYMWKEGDENCYLSFNLIQLEGYNLCEDDCKDTPCDPDTVPICHLLDEEKCDSLSGCNTIIGYLPEDVLNSEPLFLGCTPSSSCDNLWVYTWDPVSGVCYSIPNTCSVRNWDICSGTRCISTPCEEFSMQDK
jgi:hypothetical protein